MGKEKRRKSEGKRMREELEKTTKNIIVHSLLPKMKVLRIIQYV